MCEDGIGRGDGCFVAFSRGSPLEPFCACNIFSLIANFYLEWSVVPFTDGHLGKLSDFIETDNTDAIKLLYGECRNKASIGALP